jgi:hypothetical protein
MLLWIPFAYTQSNRNTSADAYKIYVAEALSLKQQQHTH